MAKQFHTGIEILGGDLTVEGEQIFLGEGGEGLSISKLFDSEIYFSADDGAADGVLAFQIEGNTHFLIQDALALFNVRAGFAEGAFFRDDIRLIDGTSDAELKIEAQYLGAAGSVYVFDGVETGGDPSSFRFSLSSNVLLSLSTEEAIVHAGLKVDEDVIFGKTLQVQGEEIRVGTNTAFAPVPAIELRHNAGVGTSIARIEWQGGSLGGDLTINLLGTSIARIKAYHTTMEGFLKLDPDIYSSGNPVLELVASDSTSYTFYADNQGAGSDNTRVWLDGPQGGQVVIGPRASGVRFNSIRFRGRPFVDVSPYSGSLGYPMAYIRASGTWTPRVAGTSGNPSVSYHLRTGMYMRIENLVWISAHVIIETISGGSGTLYLADLPFASANHNGYRTNLNVALNGVSYVSGGQVWGAMAQNQTAVHFIAQRNGASFQSVGVTNVSNGADIWLTGFYWTDDS